MLFVSTLIYFLLIPEIRCGKHTPREITRNIAELSNKLSRLVSAVSREWQASSTVVSQWKKNTPLLRENRVRETGKQDVPGARCFIVTVGYYTGEARSNGPLLLPLLVSWCGLEEHNAAKPPAIRLQSDIFTQLLVIGRSSRGKSS